MATVGTVDTDVATHDLAEPLVELVHLVPDQRFERVGSGNVSPGDLER